MVIDGNETYGGDHDINIKLECCTPETYMMSYTNFTSIKKQMNITISNS